MNKIVNSTVVCAVILVVCYIALLGLSYGIGYNEGQSNTAPTYHCDGPGYPAPGTAEARACWIEESK